MRSGVPLIETVEMAVDLKSRIIGLLGRSSLGANRAMYLAPCNSIHTFFMKFSLDVVFLDPEMNILKKVINVRPCRVVLGGLGAHGVLEFESGCFCVDDLNIGDKLILKNIA
ncbi:MAG: hypothetical protein A2283_08305 [Lentisphaerae bacterium RIFOXYA12_FULL_48_11]|nr:MAG: hypothetical protein A2283_08305 [Lentisphaerae bacterium RIFOXYA12_FULL_48_11]